MKPHEETWIADGCLVVRVYRESGDVIDRRLTRLETFDEADARFVARAPAMAQLLLSYVVGQRQEDPLHDLAETVLRDAGVIP